MLGGAFTGFPIDGFSDMISFLGLGEEGHSETRKAIEWVAERVDSEQDVKGLINLDEVKVKALIPRPRKNVVY